MTPRRPLLYNGCTVDEIDDLERRHNVKLPESYRRFLEESGRGKPGLFPDSNWTYDELDELQREGDDMLKAGGYGPLPKGAFVFDMYLSASFYFLWNTEVWFYTEVDSAPVKRFNSFGEFLERFGNAR